VAPEAARVVSATPGTATHQVPVPESAEAEAVAAEAPAPEAPRSETVTPEAAGTETATPEPSIPASPAADASRIPAADGDLPAWAQGLAPVVLGPDRLLGRPKQTALIMDRDLSSRADALVAATGPRVTFAALVTAILHFELPADGEAAARAIGGYRRRQLETLDRPWEERNARLPEPLRRELDDVVAGATGRVASVRRSTLVNALLDAHLPATPDEASRLVMRMEMVRGGAFLDVGV
jgi:hypothetical protein